MSESLPGERSVNESRPFFLANLRPAVLSASASAHLDLLRTVAAWAVMWGHLRGLFFLDYQNLTNTSGPLKLIYFLTGFGHQAVLVFFVLSGFLISSSVWRNHFSKTWSWGAYAISRGTRLYIVLIPGLIFGALWDSLGLHFFREVGRYAQPLVNFNGMIVANTLTAGTFLGNLLFLQTIFCPTFGSNGPLWSIANEFWYYLLFPLGLSASMAFSRKNFGLAFVLALFGLCLSVFLGIDKMLGFLIWLAGFAVMLACAKLPLRGGALRWFYFVLTSLTLAGFLAAARLERLPPVVSELAVGLGFSAFLYGFLQLDISIEARGSYARWLQLFAGFSYSLYVLHFPLLFLLRAWLVPGQKWVPDGRHLLFGAGIGIFILLFAWLVSLGTERKTGELRKRLQRSLGMSR